MSTTFFKKFQKTFKKLSIFLFFLHFSLLFTSKSISQAACLLGSCVCLPLDFFVPSLSSNIQYVTSRLLFLDFLVPSLHFNVQSSISWLLFWTSTCLRSNVQSTAPQLPFWTPICLLSTLTSKQPHSSYYNPATS